jgi:cbb3-type cytochrome oxidase subunit 1
MNDFENIGLRFVRWGAGFLILGLLTGYGPLGHYLMGGVQQACPWAPVHGHVATLGWMGMTLFGLVYRAIPAWSRGATPAYRLARAHFVVCAIAVVGVFGNGIVGYRILDALVDGFYYQPVTSMLNLWLSIDGLFLSLYGVGCVMFLAVLLKSTRYSAIVPAESRTIAASSPATR